MNFRNIRKIIHTYYNVFIIMVIILIVVSLLSAQFPSPHHHLESYYQEKIASYLNGQREVILNDGTRIDVMTKTKVIEVEFAHKWYEAIGQSAHYALKTGKKPYIYLIKECDEDDKYIERCKEDLKKGIGIRQNGRWVKIKMRLYNE